MLRVAAAQYPITAHPNFASWHNKQRTWVDHAASAGANVLLFPEYAALELTSTLPDQGQGLSVAQQLQQVQESWQDVRRVYADLARVHGVWILGGTVPELSPAGSSSLQNRAYLFAPDGRHAVQAKLQMTRFELEEWQISPGSGGALVRTPWGNVATVICYDIEFPLIARRLVERGADLILVPSCTDTLAGHHRVTIGSRARALENQCYVVQAATVGTAPWSIALDENHGVAAAFGPVDRGFPDDGVLARGELDTPGWVYADLDFAALHQVRRAGQVRNFADFSLPAHLAGEIDEVDWSAG
jgi:predicted amidohydrolase